jgi:hypothetical protein
MALIEYDIEYKNGKSHVTYKVVEVDKGDRISFKSNYPHTGIKYKKGSPFSGSNAPQANVVFEVGKGTKGPFTVTETLTSDNILHFDCGEVVAVKSMSVSGEGTHGPGLNSWGSGATTPDE